MELEAPTQLLSGASAIHYPDNELSKEKSLCNYHYGT